MGFTIISSVTQMTRQGVGAVIFFHAHTESREIISRQIWQAEVIPSSHKQIFFVKMSKFLKNVHLLHLGWGKFLLKDNQSIFYKHINVPTILGKRRGWEKTYLWTTCKLKLVSRILFFLLFSTHFVWFYFLYLKCTFI